MNNMFHNQLSLFGDRVSDNTLEEVTRFLQAVKNIGKIVSINVVSDAYTSSVSDVTVWTTSVRCDFDLVALVVLMRNATTGRKRQQQIDWAQVT